MTRRAFIRALSGAILTTLLGVRPWRLAVQEPPEAQEFSLSYAVLEWDEEIVDGQSVRVVKHMMPLSVTPVPLARPDR